MALGYEYLSEDEDCVVEKVTRNIGQRSGGEYAKNLVMLAEGGVKVK